MLTRAAIVALFVLAFCFVGFPSHSKPKPAHSSAKKAPTATIAQDPPLTVSMTKIDQPSGGTAWNLTGRYQNAGRVVNLRASTVKTVRNLVPGPPPPDSPEPTEQGFQPDADYYYANSEMSKSDGTILVEATYEYERSTDRSMLYITLGGVTLSFDLNTQEPGQLSDADQQKLDAWTTSQDAALVQDASASIITDGSQQADPEILLNYYAVAMLVDFTPPTASIPKKQTQGKNALHHAVGTLMADTASFLCGNDISNGSRIRPNPGRTKTSIGGRQSSTMLRLLRTWMCLYP